MNDREHSQPLRGQAAWRLAVKIYVFLAFIGVVVLIEFVPFYSSFDDLSLLQILVCAIFTVVVIGPLVAIAYLTLNVVVEGVVEGLCVVCRACFGRVLRFIRRLVGLDIK